ncbi:transposase [Thermosynechococcus sp. GLH187]|nr:MULTISPECIES: transposase [unclassified Thermosynechococcus]WNC45323.1 transposase [Thermosynechococcus sp. GLH187]WNC50395.1 transposase [Thermosynechococcus sp. GLH87]
MMDNAPIHPKGAIQAVVKAAGHEVLFLPKYSPDLNVIEHDFSNLTGRLRYFRAPSPEATVRVHSFAPLCKILTLHLVLLRILTLCF